MVPTTTRTPQEIFEHHGGALVAGDMDGIVSDYADDAIIITPSEILRGKDGVRKAFEKLLGDLPSADWELVTTLFEDDVMFLEWKARSQTVKADDGIDTFIFRDGLIRVQTVRYTLTRVD